MTKPGSFFHLRNIGEQSCHVLYIVSPAYLFEIDESGFVIYDDAIIIKENWDELKKADWRPIELPSKESIKKAREASYRRLSEKK